MRKNLNTFIFCIVVPLLIGAVIYLWTDQRVFFLRFLRNHVMNCPERGTLGLIARLLRNYGCDMLWAFALSSAVMLLMDANFRQAMLLCLSFETLMEGLQIIPAVSGTFDWVDLFLEWAVSVSIVMYYRLKGKEDEKKNETCSCDSDIRSVWSNGVGKRI